MGGTVTLAAGTPLVDPQFRLDPEFEAELPKSAEEVRALEALLLVEDCREPLIAWHVPDGDLLVHGYTRYRFLSLIGKPYDVIWMGFADREEVIDYIVKVHEGKRNLSAEAKAYYSGRRYNREKQGHGGVRGARGASGHSDHLLKTCEILAKNIMRAAKLFAAMASMPTPWTRLQKSADFTCGRGYYRENLIGLVEMWKR